MPSPSDRPSLASNPNHPPAEQLRIVSLPGNRFGYRCNACGGTMSGLASRAHGETAARLHECPDPDWREIIGASAVADAPEPPPADKSWIEMEGVRPGVPS